MSDASVQIQANPFYLELSTKSDSETGTNGTFWGAPTAVLSQDEIAPQHVFGTRLEEFVDTLKRW